MRPVSLIAHRGYSGRFPENTLEAFTQAIAFGADGVECDVQKTKDGRFVILHDATIDRTSNGKGSVADLSLSDLKTFDFGGGQKIPELSELLDVIPKNRWINIEVKEETISRESCRQIANIVMLSGHREWVIFSSFDHSLLQEFKQAGFKTGALIGEQHAKNGIWGVLGILRQVRPTYLNLPVQAFGRVPRWQVRFLIWIFRLRGSQIVFWTVNQLEDLLKVRAFSDLIITDQVENIGKWLSS